MKIGKYNIDTSSLLKKGVPNITDDWGVYFITGYQGTGKTYFSVKIALNYLDYKIYTNIKSLNIPGKEIHYFNTINEIENNTEEYCLFIIDEISKKYDKNTRTDTLFYGWLQQSRKRKRICVLITQEWKEVPMWLRRPARFMYNTKRIPLLPLFITYVGDALNQTYDKDTQEWLCPIVKAYIYKRNKCITDLYDTMEPINTL